MKETCLNSMSLFSASHCFVPLFSITSSLSLNIAKTLSLAATAACKALFDDAKSLTGSYICIRAAKKAKNSPVVTVPFIT